MTPDRAEQLVTWLDEVSAIVCELGVTAFILVGIGAWISYRRIYWRAYRRAFRKWREEMVNR